jgi:molecular chaperone DnaJ
MSTPDLYAVLGVSRDASPEEIKSSYRRLARQYHPDVNKSDADAEERFKEIGQAYAILSDEQKRAQYDRFGTTDDVPSDTFFGGASTISDLFEMFFGATAGPGARSRRTYGRDGDDVQVELRVSLAEVLHGVERSVKYRRWVRCDECAGTGAEGGAQPERCENCSGQGVVSRVQNTFIGQVRTSATCPNCNGEGTVIKKRCPNCKGRGLTMKEAEVSLKVPPGVESGSTLRASGRGGEPTGQGRPGDLYAVILVEDDARFVREGANVQTRIELSFAQAALGDEVTLQGVDESVDLDIPAGTQPGHVFRIRGKGLPRLGGGPRGDLYVQAVVKVPETLNQAQINLIRELAEVSGEEVPRGSEGDGGLLGGLFKGKKRK